ncbi:hypothetical protein V496_07572 [Pseudogymnoascus sp. VKM F-4515 (FW-2607)]|nr:hypothetical protein V496_07572 [Pseudogymnoascus sp. VKM F-4515 (FW-2607)]KFY78342.1 hypothetical protein V498_09130 [Pseudogymnoascus sp. VKM F-4517 (FW-2822)]
MAQKCQCHPSGAQSTSLGLARAAQRNAGAQSLAAARTQEDQGIAEADARQREEGGSKWHGAVAGTRERRGRKSKTTCVVVVRIGDSSPPGRARGKLVVGYVVRLTL